MPKRATLMDFTMSGATITEVVAKPSYPSEYDAMKAAEVLAGEALTFSGETPSGEPRRWTAQKADTTHRYKVTLLDTINNSITST